MPLNCPMCERRGCRKPADGVLAIDVELAFELNGNRYLHQVTGDLICAMHLAEIDVIAVLCREYSANAVKAMRLGTARAVLLPLNHPDAKLAGKVR